MSVFDRFEIGEWVVAMSAANGKVYVATDRSVYLITPNDELQRLKFVRLDEIPPDPQANEAEVQPGPQVNEAEVHAEPGFDPHQNSLLMQDDNFRKLLGEMREHNGLA